LQRIAVLCEKYQLHQRALELYKDIKDIKRVLVQVQCGCIALLVIIS
jgi:hypothetical protein